MKKRMLAILLCLVMVASLMPMSVFATDTQHKNSTSDVRAEAKSYKAVTVADLDVPAANTNPDMNATVTLDGATHAATVTWNLITGTGDNYASTALDETYVFADKNMYSSTVTLAIGENDKAANTFSYNGETVTVYGTDAEFDKAIKNYDGTEDVTVVQFDDTNDALNIITMYKQLPHVHTWSSDWSTDDEFHWHKCTLESCAEISDKAAHVDADNNGKCDVCGVGVATVVTYKAATVADLDAPAANTNPDMNATVTLDGAAHTGTVAWNLINGTGNNYSTSALVGTSTFVAEGMYSSVVTLKLDADTLVSNQFTYNGTVVTVYGTDDAFNSALKSYDGTKDMTLVQFDDANDVLNIITMYKQLPHAHKWSSDWSKDKDNHWHSCTFTGCTEISDRAAHVDADNNGKCDVCDCSLTTVVTHKELHITDLDKPAANKPVDFTATVTPSGEYGNCSVYWNKVKDLNKWSSDKLTSGNSFAAGNMYNTGVLVKYGKGEQIANDFRVTLNGENVPYYASAAEADKALHTYNGSNNVYAAYATTLKNGDVAIMIGGMFAKLPDTHTHTFSKDWLEDSNYHWKACSCGEISQKGGHFDNNNTGKCDVCGYVMANSTHKHNFGNKWLNDKSYHWQACSCGAISGKAVHFDNNKTGKCDVCGFPMANAVKPSTGDQSNIGLWIGAFVVAGVALVAIPVVLKKRKNNGDD